MFRPWLTKAPRQLEQKVICVDRTLPSLVGEHEENIHGSILEKEYFLYLAFMQSIDEHYWNIIGAVGEDDASRDLDAVGMSGSDLLTGSRA